jgi:hypothetical protein
LWVFPFLSKSFEKWSAFTLGAYLGKQFSYLQRCYCHLSTHLKATISLVFFKAHLHEFLISMEAQRSWWYWRIGHI